MQKLSTFRIEDICADAEEVAATLNKACRQPSGRYRVRGLCQVDSTVHVVLLRADVDHPQEEYRFVQLQDLTTEGVSSMLAERWAAGFDCLGTVSAEDGLVMCLFANVGNSP